LETTELDRLIVNNLAEIEATWDRVEQLDQHLWSEVGEFVANWANEKGWSSECDENTIKAYPADWATTDEDNRVNFYLAWGPDDTEKGVPYSWLARFAGISGARLCLWLEQSVGSRTWKPIARTAEAQLSPLGFSLSNGGHFYTECTLDAAVLAGSLANQQLASAFTPIGEALGRAKAAAPLFSPLLKAARAL
jgi:hypothetical protein